MKKMNWRDKMVRFAVVLLTVIALAGCSSKPETGSPSEGFMGSSDSIESGLSASPSETEESETISSQPPTSEPSGIDISGPISYETAKTLVKDMALDVTYEEVIRRNENSYGGYEVVTQETCEELKEVLSVYFTCFFHPEIWGDYEFIDDGVMERWEEMCGKAMEDTSLEEIADQGISLLHVYYHDEKEFFIKARHKNVFYMHLTKTDGQWYIEETVMVGFYREYYFEGDPERAAAQNVEALKKGREEKPVTEEMIQEALAEVIESYTDPMFGLTPEETEALKKDVEALRLEAFYEENWCDKILAFACSMGMLPNFNETAFVLWVQPGEGYDPALQELVDGLYGKDGGEYYLVIEVPGEGWNVSRMWLFDIPEFSLRSEEWNAEWNVW